MGREKTKNDVEMDVFGLSILIGIPLISVAFLGLGLIPMTILGIACSAAVFLYGSYKLTYAKRGVSITLALVALMAFLALMGLEVFMPGEFGLLGVPVALIETTLFFVLVRFILLKLYKHKNSRDA